MISDMNGPIELALEQDAMAVEATLKNVLTDGCGVEDSEVHFLHVAQGEAPGIRFLAMSCVYILLVCDKWHMLSCICS